MEEGISALRAMVDRVRNTFHGADSAHNVLVDSKEFGEDEHKYVVAIGLMNNSAVYIASAQNFYHQNDILEGFSEFDNYFTAFFDFQFEFMKVVTAKEQNLSWFQSRYDIFLKAKKEIENLIEIENENYGLLREQHKKNAEDYKQNAHKLFTKGN